MRFPGYWVSEDNGRVIIHITTFDETELDPKTDWKEAWQNQDANSSAKGFVENGQVLAHAAKLISRNEGHEISNAEILAMQNTVGLFEDGKCELHNMDELRSLCMVFNSIHGMNPKMNPQSSVTLPEAVEEIPFK